MIAFVQEDSVNQVAAYFTRFILDERRHHYVEHAASFCIRCLIKHDRDRHVFDEVFYDILLHVVYIWKIPT